MDIFEIVNGHVVPTAHILNISPFKEIWKNDSDPDKVYSLQVFDYVDKLCSPKTSNVFYSITDIEARTQRVKKEVFGDVDYGIDMDTMFAVIKYKELLSFGYISFGLLEDAVAAAEKTRQWFKDFDYSIGNSTNSGAMKIKPKEVLSALKEVPDVVKKLEQLRQDVMTETKEAGATRAGRTPGPFEE